MRLGSREGIRFVGAEILTTSIGILIALGANSAWQGHQDRRAELRSLREIRVAIQSDREDLNGDLTAYNMRGSAAELILARGESGRDSVGMDSVFRLLVNARAHFSNTAPFQALQASGIEVIQTDSLRLALLNYYSVVNMFVASTNAYDATFITSEMAPYVHVHTRVAMRGNVPSGVLPVNYRALMKDNYFQSLLAQMGWNTDLLRRSYGAALTSASNLVAMIDRRIAELN